MKNFIIELPDTSKTHHPDIFYEDKNKLCDELNIQRLEYGVDSFELRLWVRVGVLNGGQVLVIKKIGHEWCCLNYKYIERQINFEPLGYRIDTIWVKKERPKSKWSTFFTEVANEKIYELPSQFDVPGFKSDIDDGITYCIEFADKQKYKFYWYNCPDFFENKYAECKHMTNIIKIFKKEGFDVTTINDSHN